MWFGGGGSWLKVSGSGDQAQIFGYMLGTLEPRFGVWVSDMVVVGWIGQQLAGVGLVVSGLIKLFHYRAE